MLMERELSGETFERTGRAKELVAYVVAMTLLDQPLDVLNETAIAQDLWGDKTYDPVSENYVRHAVVDARAKLQRYYETEGCKAPIRISIPPRSYIPEIHDRRPSIKVSDPDDWNPKYDIGYLCRAIGGAWMRYFGESGMRVGAASHPNDGKQYALRSRLDCNRRHIAHLNVSLCDLQTGDVICSLSREQARECIIGLADQVALAILTVIQSETDISLQVPKRQMPETNPHAG